MKVIDIIGARPQFIKLGAMHRAICEQNRTFRSSSVTDGIEPVTELIVHTGQHYDYGLSKVFFEELEIPEPDYNLGVGSGSHAEQTGEMLKRLGPVLREERPDIVLVYGDTNSTLAGSLAAAKLHVPVAHVEAGLRSFRRDMPEEVNRVIADHVSTLLFCPTSTAVDNLRGEGIVSPADPLMANANAPGVFLVGDVMKDAVRQNLERAKMRPSVTAKLGIRDGEYAVATVHRAENTDNPPTLRNIARTLSEIASGMPVLVPLHPCTRSALKAAGIEIVSSDVLWIEPLSYLDMLRLVSGAKLVLTDSGGLQKEAYLLGVPCVTLRDETEWLELVEAGWNRLAGADPTRIIKAVRAAVASATPTSVPDLYGDGKAAAAIAAICLEWYRNASA